MTAENSMQHFQQNSTADIDVEKKYEGLKALRAVVRSGVDSK